MARSNKVNRFTIEHIRAILLLPFMATIIIPGLILYLSRPVKIGWRGRLSVGLLAAITGLSFIAMGLTLIVRTVAMFATIGKGTLAPWNPPQRLVVRGVYRHVRNPMISGVVAILLGEATLLGLLPLLVWALIFLVINIIYMPLVEEPDLERRFGADYLAYKQQVPRWIPRLRPWQGLIKR